MTMHGLVIRGGQVFDASGKAAFRNGQPIGELNGRLIRGRQAMPG
jgi:hypothetical protein